MVAHKYVETSAKSRKNIDEAFFAIAREIRKEENPEGDAITTKKKKSNPIKKLKKTLCKTV